MFSEKHTSLEKCITLSESVLVILDSFWVYAGPGVALPEYDLGSRLILRE
jgi:hypothetical protein